MDALLPGIAEKVTRAPETIPEYLTMLGLRTLLNMLFSVLLGAMFFGGLWWTIRRGLSSQHPALWFFSSLLLRTAIVLAGLALWLPRQGMVAGEWVLGSAEPKTFAYALLLLAFVSWRRGRSSWGGLQAGLACSAHVLVGGYGALSLAALAWLRSAQLRMRWWPAIAAALVGAFALYRPVLGRLVQLATPAPANPLRMSPIWLYVPFRHPHHLVPSTWGRGWLLVVVVLLGWMVVGHWLRRAAVTRLSEHELEACRDLWRWSALALVPFGVGLLLSLVDADGFALQLYPFRLADTLLPLTLVLGYQKRSCRAVLCPHVRWRSPRPRSAAECVRPATGPICDNSPAPAPERLENALPVPASCAGKGERARPPDTTHRCHRHAEVADPDRLHCEKTARPCASRHAEGTRCARPHQPLPYMQHPLVTASPGAPFGHQEGLRARINVGIQQPGVPGVRRRTRHPASARSPPAHGGRRNDRTGRRHR